MAKTGINAESLSRELIREIGSGVFKPVYLLMGDEPYYPDRVCDAILENAVEEDSRDFDQFVFYGADTDAETVITAARGYSMFGGRVLVVLKEAQLMKDLEKLAFYCEKPLDSTVLVICLHGASVDKRKALYKSVTKIGAVLESPAIRDYELPDWIQRYYASLGLQIDPQAARLLAESTGADLARIASETDKLRKNLPEGAPAVSVEDVEKNVGVSREFSIFELTKALSFRNRTDALRIASHLGTSARFAMPMATSALYPHFYRILRYEALLEKGGSPDPGEKARVLGVNPYFFREYDTAVRNYPLRKAMAAVSLLCEYDYKGKGGGIGPDTPPGEILLELVTKLLNI